MPRVSVLLTCFNHVDYIAEAYESIQNQTLQDLEIIAIDDGSTDGTREWLQKNAKNCTIIFNESNLGTYASLNVGLKNASGEFIAILNDDDVWESQKLESQLVLFDDNSAIGLVHTNGVFIDSVGKVREGSPLGFDFPRTECGDVLAPLIYANKIIASAVLVRKKCFDTLGCFDERYFGSGDWQMWLRIAQRYDVGYVDEKLTRYRIHGSNASHRLERIWRDDQLLREWIEAQMPDYYASNRDREVLDSARAHNWACLGTVRTLNGDPKGGRAAYAESLRIRPGRWKSRLRWLATYLPTSAFRKLSS